MTHICPTCQNETEAPAPPSLLTIGGEAYKIVKRSEIKKRYIFVSDEEVLYCPPIPLLIVQKG